MMSMRQLFYDDAEPIWPVDTAASQTIRYPTSNNIIRTVPPTVRTAPPVVPPPLVINREQARPPPALVREVMPPALQYKVLEFRVPLCCEGCQERVVKRLRKVMGVDFVHCDLNRHKVTVKGYATPADVLMACKSLFKRSEFWTPEPPQVVVLDKPQRSARELV